MGLRYDFYPATPEEMCLPLHRRLNILNIEPRAYSMENMNGAAVSIGGTGKEFEFSQYNSGRISSYVKRKRRTSINEWWS